MKKTQEGFKYNVWALDMYHLDVYPGWNDGLSQRHVRCFITDIDHRLVHHVISTGSQALFQHR